MSLTEAVEAMKSGKLARPIAWRGSQNWMERAGGGFYLFTQHHQPVLFCDSLLGEWEVLEWDRKTPMGKLPE